MVSTIFLLHPPRSFHPSNLGLDNLKAQKVLFQKALDNLFSSLSLFTIRLVNNSHFEWSFFTKKFLILEYSGAPSDFLHDSSSLSHKAQLYQINEALPLTSGNPLVYHTVHRLVAFTFVEQLAAYEADRTPSVLVHGPVNFYKRASYRSKLNLIYLWSERDGSCHSFTHLAERSVHTMTAWMMSAIKFVNNSPSLLMPLLLHTLGHKSFHFWDWVCSRLVVRQIRDLLPHLRSSIGFWR